MSVAIVLASVCAALAAAGCLTVPATARCRSLTTDDTESAARPSERVRQRFLRRTASPSSGRGEVAATLDLLAAALDAGLPPTLALTEVAAVQPGRPEGRLQTIVSMLELSADTDSVWRLLADDPEFGALGQSLARAERSGAPMAESIRGLADESRRAARAERLDRARSVGVRTAAPLGLCFLPAFLLIAVVPTILGLIRQAF